MKWAFELLGLTTDADATSVKRAYARLLRTTRPDEDPEAFQRLHAAYKTALAQASAAPAPVMHTAKEKVDAIQAGQTALADPPPPVTPAAIAPLLPSLAETPQIVIPVAHIPALADEVLRTAADTDDSDALLQWLQTKQEFWSITIKQQAGQLVIHRLLQSPQAMSARSLDLLLNFFNLDHVLSGIDPFALQQLRRRQAMQWELIPRNYHLLAQRTHLMRDGRADTLAVKRYLDLLQKPLGWSPVIRAVRRYNWARDIGRFVHALCHGRLDELPPQFNKQHAQFWIQSATNGRTTWPRFVVGTIRTAMVAFASMLLIAGIFAFSFSMGGIAGPEALSSGTTVSMTMAASILSLWLLYSGWMVLDQWQGAPESAAEKKAWRRRIIVPALCFFSLILDYLLKAPLWAGLMALTTLALSARRLWQRLPQKKEPSSFQLGRFRWLIWFAGIALARASADSHADVFDYVPIVAGSVFIALGLWVADMWRHRAYLHPRFARHRSAT